MPTYSYRCTECSTAFDIQQAFTDDALTECPACQGRLRKIFSVTGVTFNGSGFYRTDSRAGQGGSESGSSSSSGSSGSSSSDSGSSSAKSSAPAAACDRSGMRMGWGRGYFDKTLGSMDRRPPVYAVVYDDEIVDALPHEPHDQPVDGAVTPSGLHRF